MNEQSNGLDLARKMDEVLNRGQDSEATAEQRVKELLEEPEGSESET